MRNQLWPNLSFLALLIFHLYYAGVLSSKTTPVQSCENLINEFSVEKNLVRVADPHRENFYRFYNVENLKPGFEKIPDLIVGEAVSLAKSDTHFECKITLYN